VADIPMAGAGNTAATPSAAPQAQAAPSPTAQATGPTPATTPVPNRGGEQSALLAIGMHAQQIQKLMAQLPFGSDAAQAIGEALNKMRKHIPPPGSIPSGVEKAQMEAMQNAQRQNAMRMALAKQQQAQGGGAGAGGAGAPPPMGAPRPPPQLMQ
jgi:hypothetical protein